MSGIVEQALTEYLPVTIGALSYSAGAALDMYAQKQVAQARDPLAPEWEGIVEAPTAGKKLRVAFLGALAFVAAGAGYVNADAWQPSSTTDTMPAAVEIVADVSGATILEGGLPNQHVVEVTEALAETEDAEEQLFVARGGNISIAETQNIDNISPLGDAPLTEGVENALDEIGVSSDESVRRSGGAIVVLTYGNTISNAEDIVNRANSLETPIYVVNVESSQSTGDKTMAELKAITDQTGGVYWNMDQTTTNDIRSTVEDSLQRVPTPADQSTDKNNPWPYRAFGALMAVGVVLTYQARKFMPLVVDRLKFKKGN